MDVGSIYRSKLTTPDQAVASIPSGSKFSMGMAMAEPPALLKALADRAEARRPGDDAAHRHACLLARAGGIAAMLG
jgi:itaconate CoA-transferase